MPITPNEAKKMNEQLMTEAIESDLVSLRSKIDTSLRWHPEGITANDYWCGVMSAAKKNFTLLAEEYRQLGWHTRVFEKNHCGFMSQYLEILASSPTELSLKEKVLNFLENC